MKNLKEIDSWMEYISLGVIKKEYDNGRIHEESNLHSTVYFHLRKLIERSGKKKLFLYSETPFSTKRKGEGKKNPRVDLAIVILDKENETPSPVDLLAVIELKYYEKHTYSFGIKKDLDHLEAIRKGVYYPYKPTKKLIPRRAYFLYLVDEGQISFNSMLERKMDRLKQMGYLKIFFAEGEKKKFNIK